MYIGLLHLHNSLRWLILAGMVTLMVVYSIRWLARKGWRRSDGLLSLVVTILVDVQLLTGLVLYFFISPVTRAAFHDFGAAMKNADLRFYAVEHTVLMLAAVVMVHLGRSAGKKATRDGDRFRVSVIFFGMALVLMLVGIPWSRL